MKLQVLLVLIFVAFASPAFSVDLYTSSTGSDTANNCRNIATPCSIVNGFANEMAQVSAGRGDIIHVCAGACDGSGSYTNIGIRIYSWDYTIPSGTSYSNALTIEAYGGETITLGQIGLYHGNQYIIFRGLKLKGDGIRETDGITTSKANHIRFENMEISLHGQHGIEVSGGSFFEFLNVSSHDNGNQPTASLPYMEHCIYLQGGVSDVLIDGGSYYNCIYGMGIHDWDHDVNRPVRTTLRNARIFGNKHGAVSNSVNSLFYNNLVYGNVQTGGFGTGMGFDVGASGKVLNNTIYGNGWSCGNSYSIAVEIRNNICWSNSPNLFEGKFTASNNICGGPGCISNSDPQFVDTTSFRLKVGSPAIGAGVSVSEVTTDIFGTPRPTGAYDIGATQYGTGTLVPTIGPPTNLRVVSVP